MARIIAGEYGGRHIDAPKGSDTRPTTDRVREALMSSLGTRLSSGFSGTRVLDAFAGSGALGLETLSRGAAFCVFIDTDARARKVIDANLKSLDVPASRYMILPLDIFDAVSKGRIPAGPFDLVLLDPPYVDTAARVLELTAGLAAGGFLADRAVIAYEHANGGFDVEATSLPQGIEVIAQHTYGKTMVTTLRWKDSR